MSEAEIQFQPLEFTKTTHKALQPPIFDGDHTRGDDYALGRLTSLHYAKKEKALLFTVLFSAGPDADKAGWGEDERGEVEFIMFEKQGRFIGAINRQEPIAFLELGDEKYVSLDSLGTDKVDGRRLATFFCRRWMSSHSMRIPLTVSVYIRKNLFGGWKEIVVKVPKKDLYLARL